MRGLAIAPAGTLGWMAARYFESGEFRGLDAQSQATRRLIIEDCLREPRKPGSPDLMAGCPISALGTKHVQMFATARPLILARRTTAANIFRRCSAGRSKLGT